MEERSWWIVQQGNVKGGEEGEGDVYDEWKTVHTGELLPTQSGLPTDCWRLTECVSTCESMHACVLCMSVKYHCCQAEENNPGISKRLAKIMATGFKGAV